jgi:ABC-type nitrate/sulfonate/bicarbonate transport system substrate-binding protein
MNLQMIRRIRWVSCFVLVLLLPLPAGARDRIRVGLSSVSATNGSIWVAEEKGLFKKYGIDAAVLTMPTFFLAEEKGFRVIGDPVGMDIFYLQNTLETSRDFIRRNRDAALRFTKGYIEGIAYFKKHITESIGVLRKKLRIQSEQERDSRYLELFYNLLASKLYREIPYPSTQAIQTVLDFIASEDAKDEALDPKSFIDDSLVRELDENGFIKSLYRNSGG